jgi:hypothetical protein
MPNVLFILGSAPCMTRDMGCAEELLYSKTKYEVMVIGLTSMKMYYGPVKYVATYHPDQIQEIRNISHWPVKIISHKKGESGADIYEPHVGKTGSSALLGVRAGIRLGFTHIILCGCPLLGKNAQGKRYNKMFSPGWMDAYETIKNHVRSMSGWTMELLGNPTEEWLYGTRNAV